MHSQPAGHSAYMLRLRAEHCHTIIASFKLMLLDTTYIF